MKYDVDLGSSYTNWNMDVIDTHTRSQKFITYFVFPYELRADGRSSFMIQMIIYW